MKKFSIHIAVVMPVLVGLIFLFLDSDSIERDVNLTTANDSLVTITLSFVGDLMCHSTQFNYAMVNKDSFDFSPVFREVKDFLSSSDLLIGNLETVTAGRKLRYSGYPFFNTPDEYITALKSAGFDILITANNHSLDRGVTGVIRTIEQINLNGLRNVGTYTDNNNRDSIRLITVKGVSIAVLSYTYGTNGIEIPEGKEYLVNLIDLNLIAQDIQNARLKNPDLIIVYYHFGDEYSRKPSEYQINIVNRTIEYGADIIIGSHPHVIQPVQFFNTNNTKPNTGFAAYSLGNFFSNQQWRYSDAGVILNIELTKYIKSDSVMISSVNYIPTWVFRGITDLGKEFLILPAQKYNDSTYHYLTNSDRQKMKQAFEDTRDILSSKNSLIDVLNSN